MAEQLTSTNTDHANSLSTDSHYPTERVATSNTQHPLLSDSSLMMQISQHKLDALGMLYDRYSALSYTMALHITQDRAIAALVVQEVFQTVWRSADSLLITTSVPHWLISLTRQNALAIDQSLDRSAQTRHAPYAPAPTTRASTSPAATTDTYTIQEALNTLSAEQREVIELAYYSGLNRAAIATRLSKPISTVTTHLRSGLITLRDKLITSTPR